MNKFKFKLIEYQSHRLFVVDCLRMKVNTYLFCLDFSAPKVNGANYTVCALEKKPFVKFLGWCNDRSPVWERIQHILDTYNSEDFNALLHVAKQDMVIKKEEMEMLESFVSEIKCRKIRVY